MTPINSKRFFIISIFVSIVLAIISFLYLFNYRSNIGDQADFNHKANSILDRAIVLRLSSDPKSFNPILAQETSTTSVTSLMFVGLVKIDPFTGQPSPELAQRWEVSEDGLRWVFYLRDNLYWSDGTPLTAYDVEFTFNSLIYNPDIPNSACDIFTIDEAKIKVRALDKKRIEFILPSVFAPFLSSMTQEILPKHVLKPALENGKFNQIWGLSADPEKIVCNGPFMLQKFIPGELIELGANPYYYRKNKGVRLPYIKKIFMMIIPSDDTAVLKFLEGELDILGLRSSDYILLKKLSPVGIKLFNLGPSLASNFLAFNLNPNSPLPKYKLHWFKNRRFRIALAYAIDKQGIINTVYNGLAIEQWGPLNQGSGFFYNPNLCRFKFDLKKAKDILSELGFKDYDGDGVLEDKEGNKVELNLITNSNSSERMQILSIIAQDLERVGIKANYRGVDFNSLVVRLTSTFDWELVLIGLTGGYEPHFGKNVWCSNGSLHLWWPREKNPATDWEAEIDDIFSKAVKLLDRQKRKSLYDRWQRIISCKVPLIYTVVPLRLYAARDRFLNLKPSPYGGLLYNLDEIKIKTKNRR